MKYLKSVIYHIFFLIVLLIAGVFFFLTTTSGLHTLIKIAELGLPGHLKIQHVDGSLIQGISLTELTYSDARANIHISHGHLVWTMTMHPWHQNIVLNHVDIITLNLHRSESMSIKNKSDGDVALTLLPFHLQINQLIIHDLQIDHMKARELQLTASLDNTHWVIQQLKATYDNQYIGIEAKGQLQPASVLSATLHIDPVSPLSYALKGKIDLTKDNTDYSWHGEFTGRFPVTVKGTLRDFKRLDSTLSWGLNRFTINGNLPDQLTFNAFIPQPESLHPALAHLKTAINLNGAIGGSQHGDVNVAISPGVYQLPSNSSIPLIAFQGGNMSITLTPDALQATGELTIDPHEIIKMSLRLPKFNVYQATSAQQSINGQLSLKVNSLDFLSGLSPVMTNLHGQLSADLMLNGSLGKPSVEGILNIVDAGVSIPEMGIVLNSIQATFLSHNKQWDLIGSVDNDGGHGVTIKGKGEFLPRLLGAVTITADEFPLLKTADYSMTVSPKLTVTLNENVLDITGMIEVPTARFKPMMFSNTVNLTDDAVFVNNDLEKTSPFMHVKADVLIKPGSDVVIDAQGLYGILGGKIHLIQPLDGSMIAAGELTIRDGRYKAYGQDLAINHGQLLFAGATPENPRISLRAVRTFNNTSQFSGSDQLFDFNASNLQPIDFGNHMTVGIDVSGYLNSPKVKLFSVPSSLSQSDILSMLLLGKPANQASKSGGQLLLTAISAMNLNSGTQGMQLLSQLKQSLGLDFDVKSNSISNNDSSKPVGDTAFVVGKSLSKRLHLSYSVGIFQENSNVLILKYLLNKYFSLQVTASSSGNGLDFLYQHSL